MRNEEYRVIAETLPAKFVVAMLTFHVITSAILLDPRMALGARLGVEFLPAPRVITIAIIIIHATDGAHHSHRRRSTLLLSAFQVLKSSQVLDPWN